jgi:adenine deaminase
MITSDGSSPGFYRQRGVLSGALRVAVGAGVDAIDAIRMAALHPATFWGIDEDVGSIAPGRRADINVLPAGEDQFSPEVVICGGNVIAQGGRLLTPVVGPDWQALGCRLDLAPAKAWLDPRLCATPVAMAAGEVTMPVLAFESAVINRRQDLALPTREGTVELSEMRGLLCAALLDRGLRWASYALVGGLMDGLSGRATTFTTGMGGASVGP